MFLVALIFNEDGEGTADAECVRGPFSYDWRRRCKRNEGDWTTEEGGGSEFISSVPCVVTRKRINTVIYIDDQCMQSYLRNNTFCCTLKHGMISMQKSWNLPHVVKSVVKSDRPFMRLHFMPNYDDQLNTKFLISGDWTGTRTWKLLWARSAPPSLHFWCNSSWDAAVHKEGARDIGWSYVYYVLAELFWQSIEAQRHLGECSCKMAAQKNMWTKISEAKLWNCRLAQFVAQP